MNMKKILRMCLALLLCLLTLCPALGEAEFTRDEAREIVEALLAAAAGTTFDDEQRLRATLTEQQQTERSAFLAAYRQQTLPWLCAALGQAADAQTLAEGYAAMQTCDVGRAYL